MLRRVFSVIVCLSILMLCSCNPGEGLDNSYTGTLELRISNAYPEFDESTTVSVDIDINGAVTIGTGSLYYEGEDDNGDSKIKRAGTLTLAPSGRVVKKNGVVLVEIDENTTVDECFEMWAWDDDNFVWVPATNYEVSVTWNGGLVFDLDEAADTSDMISVANGQGFVDWTLSLAPSI
jgi:hypothetical protein